MTSIMDRFVTEKIISANMQIHNWVPEKSCHAISPSYVHAGHVPVLQQHIMTNKY